MKWYLTQSATVCGIQSTKEDNGRILNTSIVKIRILGAK